MKTIFFIFLSVLIFTTGVRSAEPATVQNPLGKSAPLDLPFQNGKGKTVLLQSFFNKSKPVVLLLVYYECPNICTFVLKAADEAFQQLKWKIGNEFEMVAVSINPNETSELAATAGKKYPGNFLVGEEKNIRALADAVGFEYRYDAETKQYAHPAAMFILTPEGKLARVLSGIQFEPRDLKLALLEASQGKIGNVIDRLQMLCYRYDPKANKYALLATNLMKAGGAVTLLVLGGIILRMKRKDGNG